ncbi:hypothetical protein AAFF_G00192220 [Aldrovandia affinis]|uniref:Uncharacterized protein n=1 Tax=Aldrovandia affinis TaxID=143900 RepID=A0AAD7RJ48_9TELE|nr:hypothetical protein AAFF_G00192220 [Aldrovandia affinis]
MAHDLQVWSQRLFSRAAGKMQNQQWEILKQQKKTHKMESVQDEKSHEASLEKAFFTFLQEMMQNCQTHKPMVQIPKDLPVPYQNNEGFRDHVYVHAAAIFQSCHMEKPADQGLINYGKKANLCIPEARDEESCLLAHELAFSSLKCI